MYILSAMLGVIGLVIMCLVEFLFGNNNGEVVMFTTGGQMVGIHNGNQVHFGIAIGGIGMRKEFGNLWPKRKNTYQSS